MHIKHKLSYSFFCYVIIFSVIFTITTNAISTQPQQIIQAATYKGLSSDKFMTDWLILGPVPVFEGKSNPEDQETQKKTFEADYLNLQTLEHIKSGQVHEIKGNQYTWQLHKSKIDIIDLEQTFGDTDFVFIYALAQIEMPEARTALIGVGSDDGLKVWLNGKLIHENWIGRPLVHDDDLVSVDFKKGKNQLLLKVQDMQYDWSFCCRMIGPELFPEKLIASAGQGDLDGLKLLLLHGADINAKTECGLTALHAAQISGRKEAAKLLVDQGADASIKMPDKDSITDAKFNQHISGESPGAAILIAQNGKILYEKGFGYADLGHDVPITPDTKFRIGSITKQVIAAAILKLQEDGKLSVNDLLSKYIDDYPRGNEVTIHHLLTHTSGIHSFTNKPDFMETATVAIKIDDMIEYFKGDKFDFNPGEKFLYNNSGYFLLGYIIEKVTGKTYDDYLEESFFEPLGMNNTGVHDSHTILKHEATGYSYVDGNFQKALNWDMSRAGGAGSLFSTTGDLFQWNEAVFNGKVLSEKSLEAAFSPAKLNDGSKAQIGSAGYGYGWGIGEFRGLKEISHSGGLNGFVSYLLRFPEQNMTIAVLANCAPMKNLEPGNVAHEIAEIFLWEKLAAQESFATDTSVDPDVYENYVGRYEYPGGAILTVTREDNRLFAQLTGQSKFEIFPSSETEFFWKVVDAQITFVKNEQGIVVHAVHRQGGQELIVPKIEEEVVADVDPAVYNNYTGEYELAKDMIISVITENNRLFVQLTGQPRFEIFPLSETVYFLKIVKAQITFIKDANGDVSSLTLNQGGIEQTARKIK